MEEVKYLHDGRAVIVRGQLKQSGEYVVSEVLEGLNGDETYIYPSEVMFTVEQVFDQAPTQALSEEVAKLHTDITELRMEKQRIENDIRRAKVDQFQTTQRLKLVSALKHIEEFIEGKITHYFVTGAYGPKIAKFAEEVSEYGSHPPLKLLTLFGETKGDLEWKINQYSDGSGSWRMVIPCLSYEEARAEGQKYLDGLSEEKNYPDNTTIQFAAEHGLTLPDWYIPKHKEATRKQTEGVIRDLEKRLVEARRNVE